MSAKTFSNIKLGLFVLAGLAFLILLLYMIGRNRSLFGSTFEARAHFLNVQGLVPGNNVRYAGIQVGTIHEINILDDGRIEVSFLIENKMKHYIRKNAGVNIATDGLMGNKVLEITPAPGEAPLIEAGDILATRSSVNMDEMINTLSGTNDDLAVIATELKSTMTRINRSAALWELLNDSSLSRNISASFANLRSATARANSMIDELGGLVVNVKNGEGTLGALLTDTSLAGNLNQAILRIRTVADEADTLAKTLSAIAGDLQHDISHGNGAVHALLKDSALVHSLHTSLDNIQKSTQSFNEVMEGMKHSFLVRRYFRKLEKEQAKKKEATENPPR